MEPALLCTFLGQVTSPLGREYERVIAVQVDLGGAPRVHTEPDDWLSLVERGVPPATKGLWERQFAPWAEAARRLAGEAATAAFQPLAENFADTLAGSLRAERGELGSWLRERTQALCGEVQPL